MAAHDEANLSLFLVANNVSTMCTDYRNRGLQVQNNAIFYAEHNSGRVLRVLIVLLSQDTARHVFFEYL